MYEYKGISLCMGTGVGLGVDMVVGIVVAVRAGLRIRVYVSAVTTQESSHCSVTPCSFIVIDELKV